MNGLAVLRAKSAQHIRVRQLSPAEAGKRQVPRDHQGRVGGMVNLTRVTKGQRPQHGAGLGEGRGFVGR
jgi:hypothetical protein